MIRFYLVHVVLDKQVVVS